MKVISGGQTGADRTALEVAESLSIETGGYCPLGCRTDNGPMFDLLYRFGLTETQSMGYHHRTELNVMGSDMTVWFGTVYSPGGRLTQKLCTEHNKIFLINPSVDMLIAALEYYAVSILNVAGNRERTNPKVVDMTRNTLYPALDEVLRRKEFEDTMRMELESVL